MGRRFRMMTVGFKSQGCIKYSKSMEKESNSSENNVEKEV
jgi:hypothetical protein